MGLLGSPLPRRLAVCGIIIFPIMLAVGTLLVKILFITDLKFKFEAMLDIFLMIRVMSVLFLQARFLPCPTPDQYLVLLDAGSVHTSIYTYRCLDTR